MPNIISLRLYIVNYFTAFYKCKYKFFLQVYSYKMPIAKINATEVYISVAYSIRRAANPFSDPIKYEYEDAERSARRRLPDLSRAYTRFQG